MSFLSKNYRQIIWFLIGTIAGFFIYKLPIHFEEKINWLALANFFLTILLAIYLEFKVRPSLSNNRNEKDILIDQLKEIKEKITDINNFYYKIRNIRPLTVKDKAAIIIKFREASNLIYMFQQTIDYCKLRDGKKISENIFPFYLGYKKSLTGRNFNNTAFHYDRLFWVQNEASHIP